MPLDRSCADVEFRADLGVRATRSSHPRNLRLLWRQVVERVNRAFADLLARGEQFVPGSLRRIRRLPYSRTPRALRAAGFARRRAGPVPSQPLAIHELCAGQLEPQLRSLQTHDRLPDTSARHPRHRSTNARDRARSPARPVRVRDRGMRREPRQCRIRCFDATRCVQQPRSSPAGLAPVNGPSSLSTASSAAANSLGVVPETEVQQRFSSMHEVHTQSLTTRIRFQCRGGERKAPRHEHSSSGRRRGTGRRTKLCCTPMSSSFTVSSSNPRARALPTSPAHSATTRELFSALAQLGERTGTSSHLDVAKHRQLLRGVVVPQRECRVTDQYTAVQEVLGVERRAGRRRRRSCSADSAAATPRVTIVAMPSRSQSPGPGSSVPAGADCAASDTSMRSPPSRANGPATRAALQASRYVRRASRASSGSSRRAARRSPTGASPAGPRGSIHQAPDQVDARPLEFVVSVGLSFREQSEGRLERTDIQIRSRRRQLPLSPEMRVGGERSRTVQKRRGGRHASTSHSVMRCADEFGRHVLVGPCRR